VPLCLLQREGRFDTLGALNSSHRSHRTDIRFLFIVLSVRASWISSPCMLLVAWICSLELVQFSPFSYMGSVYMEVVRRALVMSAPRASHAVLFCCLV